MGARKVLGEDRLVIGRVVGTRGRVQGEAKQSGGRPASGRNHFWCGQGNEVGRTESNWEQRKEALRGKLSWSLGGLCVCFPPVSFPRLFLCSLSLLPLLPASSAPLPSSSGNGRLLGRRSKRRNCLQVQSSKKASSIWRDWVRWARRLLPCPLAAAAATKAPASCSGDPELGFAGVSSGHAHTLSHLVLAVATQALPSRPRNFWVSGSFVAPAAATLPWCVSPCVTALCKCVGAARGAVWPSPRHHAGPGAPAPSSQAPAAGEVSHVTEVCFLFIKSCVYLLVWG